jgi:hypothetical protein
MTELLCAIIAVLLLIIGAFVRLWWQVEAERERDEAVKQADYDGWMP